MEKPIEYSTQQYFNSKRVENRMHLVLDEENGIRPTKWQKFCLVLTRMYSTKKEIPEFILLVVILI